MPVLSAVCPGPCHRLSASQKARGYRYSCVDVIVPAARDTSQYTWAGRASKLHISPAHTVLIDCNMEGEHMKRQQFSHGHEG